MLTSARVLTWMVALSVLPATASAPRHLAQPREAQLRDAVVLSEFIGAVPPTPSAHASTIVETPDGVSAAWFGGTREGAPDVGIWLARKVGATWLDAMDVATGVGPDGRRYACYNPVLFYTRDRVLHLYYKVGPQPAKWWGMHMESRDDGVTWTAPTRLPDGILGPIKNKPVVLSNGTVVSGSSTESIDADPTWRVHMEISRDDARTWRVTPSLSWSGDSVIHAIQPAIVLHRDGRLQALGRTRSLRIFDTWSSDGGETWSPITLTTLPNPNAGIDAVALRDGRTLIVYNHSTSSRAPLGVALSDDGRTWHHAFTIDSTGGEHSYPAVIQTADGLVHITYTWERRRIKHVVLNPALLQ